VLTPNAAHAAIRFNFCTRQDRHKKKRRRNRKLKHTRSFNHAPEVPTVLAVKCHERHSPNNRPSSSMIASLPL